jgi:hypothetical protein
VPADSANMKPVRYYVTSKPKIISTRQKGRFYVHHNTKTYHIIMLPLLLYVSSVSSL